SSLPARRHTRSAVRDRGRTAGRLHPGNAATDGELGVTSVGIFVLVLLLLFLVWLMLVRPQRRRQLNQQLMIDHLRVGDEVLTAGGFFANVVRLDDCDGAVHDSR